MSKFRFFLMFSCLAVLVRCDQKGDPISWDHIKQDINQELNKNILDKWYPTILDTLSGGYLSNLSSEFEPMANQDKMIVTQSRHLWATSSVAKKYNNPAYLKYAKHGFPFLQKMWDTEYGGFYQNVDRHGNPVENQTKTAYGNAFAIYGLSAFYEVSRDTTALQLAKETFNWLETHSHDTAKGGYFQDLNREGSVMKPNDSSSHFSSLGLKDQNSSIHLLEAFTSLHHIWPDPLVNERLSEMFYLIKDIMFNDRHHLDLYFTPDLEPISFYKQDSATILKNARFDHVSFGHDIETAYLLLEAAEELDMRVDENLLNELREIVDHSLLGLDDSNGGLFDQGYYFDRDQPLEIIKTSKAWWAQAEALNTMLIFHTYYPDAGYDEHFVNQWNYIKKYIIDPVHGGWYTNGLDTEPHSKDYPKASIWKSSYHNYRALDNCLQILNDGFTID